MTWIDWIPAASTTTVLAIALWLSKNLIITRLINSVRHEYDKKIENIKTTLRLNEELFKNELRIKESEIQALRSGALSGIVNRQTVLYERQIIAIEQTWNAIISLQQAKGISETMSVFNYQVSMKEAQKNPDFRKIFEAIDSNFDLNNLKNNEAEVARPFITPLAWSLYLAYKTIVMHAVAKVKMLKDGIDMDIFDNKSIASLVKAALPHRAEYIERNSSKTLHHLLEELECSLLTEFRKILGGEQSDRESVERAAEIIREVDNLTKIMSNSSET